MLNPAQAQDIAHRIVERARAGGADAADAVFIADASTAVQVREGDLEDVGRSESAELGLRVFAGKRSASWSGCANKPADSEALCGVFCIGVSLSSSKFVASQGRAAASLPTVSGR